ncbi:MAG: ATP synthase subunit I [Betaproteobacteria bacterium]|nr:ATP synthase subunit I [Betaproteobacteria bacterium]MDE2622712.1 ATP synthase subunit I [Betaproteobacteria bacterium]
MISRKILKIIGLQIVVTAVIGLALATLSSRDAAVSSVLGGSIGFLSGLSYAARSASSRGNTAKHWLQAQYAGERFKFVTTVILFSATFMLYRSLRLPEFFLTYIATLLVYFAALLMD